MLQKLKSGQISTFDDYVKKSDNDGKNKLIDYFQKHVLILQLVNHKI